MEGVSKTAVRPSEDAVARFLAGVPGRGSDWGSGEGSGWGSGWGSGEGSGEGSGFLAQNNFGIATFCGDAVHRIDGMTTILKRIHGNVASAAILRKDLSLSDCYVVKGNGYFAHGETLHDAQAALEAKILENEPVEERIERFAAQFKIGQEYPARQFYDWHHTLTGSCEMGRKEFAASHGIDIDKDMMTPEAFVQLTEHAYGGSVIRMLKERLGLDG